MDTHQRIRVAGRQTPSCILYCRVTSDSALLILRVVCQSDYFWRKLFRIEHVLRIQSKKLRKKCFRGSGVVEADVGQCELKLGRNLVLQPVGPADQSVVDARQDLDRFDKL